MKKIFISLSALSLLFATGICTAADHSLPKEKPVLSITFPDDWKVKADEDVTEGLVALAPDEAIEIDLWALDKQELKDDANATLAAMVEEVGTLIDDHITDFQAEKPTETTINGISVFEINGKGKDKEEGKDANVSVLLMTPDNKNLFVLMYWGSDEAEKQYEAQLVAIVSSIKKP
jgi:hypothetical protein